jgi:predicted NUDIX family NTP pyrophosphohydrolase
MPKTSAGLVMYRARAGTLEVLLVHPGGPFFARRDAGAWSIPKGAIGPGEAPLDAARREFEEETGVKAEGPFLELTPIRQRGGKVVHAWACAGDCDPAKMRSNLFTLAWPPGSGRMQTYPEIDRAAFFGMAEARRKINPGQAPLLDELVAKLGSASTPGHS